MLDLVTKGGEDTVSSFHRPASLLDDTKQITPHKDPPERALPELLQKVFRRVG